MALRALGHQRQPVRQGFRRFILFCSFSECRHLAAAIASERRKESAKIMLQGPCAKRGQRDAGESRRGEYILTEPPVGLQSNEPVSQDLCVLYTTIRGRCADSARHMNCAASAGPRGSVPSVHGEPHMFQVVSIESRSGPRCSPTDTNRPAATGETGLWVPNQQAKKYGDPGKIVVMLVWPHAGAVTGSKGKSAEQTRKEIWSDRSITAAA